jgi:two-component system, cell cycle sensor histidine kinase and response regulator CckA
LNLAVNAGHAMPNGGTLRVELKQESPDAEVLVVSDTGCGMDGETTTRIFDP